MGLTNSDYEAVMREYDSIRYENAELLHNRTKEVYEKIPEIKELEDEIITDRIDLTVMSNFIRGKICSVSSTKLEAEF